MKKILLSMLCAMMPLWAVGQVSYSKNLEREAKAGDAVKMCDLGYCYDVGSGVPIDGAKAVYWYRKAADKGNVNAIYNLGVCYENGKGVDRDYTQAASWYRKAADKGNADAMNNLGACYLRGEGVPRDYDQTVYWYVKAAKGGSKLAMENLSSLYAEGLGVSKNQIKASLLLAASKAMDANDAQRALDLVAKAFPDAGSGVPQTPSEDFPILQLVPNTISFADATGNQAIDANETCHITFTIKNSGKGAAMNCVAKVKTNAQGIGVADLPLPAIAAGETYTVKIPVEGGMSLVDGTADLQVSVDEPNGFGCDPTTLTVSTRAFETPMLKITDYAISNQTGNALKKKEPFDLQLLLQNTDHGLAEQVEVQVELPEGVFMMDGKKRVSIPSMSAGKQKELKYTLVANNDYVGNTIPVKVNLRERYGKYAESRTITLTLNQEMSANRIVVDDVDDAPQQDIAIAQIKNKRTVSDVDQNIPQGEVSSNNTFAVIIANEHYQREAKVAFAHNDGDMMRTYCQRVLGIPSRNIHLVKDATLNNILGEVEWLQQVADAYSGEANLIFYYAGHGVPDERQQKAYLLPVDGYGTNLRTGYPVESLYAGLSKCPSRSTLVFLDACFSGSQRTGERMESARAVGIRTKECTPQGNMVVFSAAQGNETAYPYKGQNHGLFTYFLLKKLKETKGEVTLGDLGDYLVTNVKRMSVVDYTKRQTPSVQPSSAMRDKWKNLLLVK